MPKAVIETWKPFSLADPSRRKSAQERLKRIEAEMMAQRAAECPFKPALVAKDLRLRSSADNDDDGGAAKTAHGEAGKQQQRAEANKAAAMAEQPASEEAASTDASAAKKSSWGWSKT